MAPYVGAAERAVEKATQHVRTAQRSTADVAQLLALGELENELLQAELPWRRMIELCNDYQFEPSLETSTRMLSCKTLTASAVKRCVAKALELVGGSALFRGAELERLLRDAQGAPFHLMPEKKQWLLSAQFALGLPLGSAA
jgi:alkylation response protein AidB-like acyl-CoA dehydrogenase